MVLKRQLRPGGEEGSNKRRHLASTICKGLNYGRNLEESVSCLEPLIRKWVQEAVDCALNPYVSSSASSTNLVALSVPSRNLQLLFNSHFPDTLFTGNKLMSEDRNPVQVVMYDSVAKQIITCGPLSSLKVTIAVMDGDFDREDWTTKEFEGKLVKNREGRRPLIAGELIVTLKNGVGYIGDVSFTDNSSWIRSGKFRLAAKANSAAFGTGDEISIREAVSNAFRVKDQRGLSYQKFYPPSLGDEVWRLEKIAKDGRTHQKLTESRIYSVGDFLRFYATDHLRLRNILGVSDKKWEAIIRHATTCNSDGNQQHPVNSLTNYHMPSMVQDLRQNAYRNPTEWTSISDPSIGGYAMLTENSAAGSFTNPNLGVPVDLQQDYQRGMGMNVVGPTVSSLSEVEQDNCSFQLGESSHSTLGSFNPSFRSSFQFADSPGGAGFCIGGNFMGSQLSTDNLPLMDDDNYEFLFLNPGNNHEGIGRIISSTNSGMVSPRSKARWCKVLAVVKWRILVRRNVAARKWKSYM